MEGMTEVNVGRCDDFEENSVSQVTVGETRIALYRIAGDEFYATNDVCTHGQALLSEGWLTDDCAIECPLHGGCFDIRTGKGLGPPIEEDIRTYPVKVEGDAVFVVVDG
jgi:nitrite reductase/ring-hydroxylating ferredoxin subunit